MVAYDSDKQEVELNDGWGSRKTFPVSGIWLKADSPTSRRRTYATLLVAGATVGALIGSVITMLLM